MVGCGGGGRALPEESNGSDVRLRLVPVDPPGGSPKNAAMVRAPPLFALLNGCFIDLPLPLSASEAAIPAIDVEAPSLGTVFVNIPEPGPAAESAAVGAAEDSRAAVAVAGKLSMRCVRNSTERGTDI